MEFFNNTLCISYGELTGSSLIMTESNYHKLVSVNKINVVRKAGGRGSCALIEFDSLPERFRQRAKEVYPESCADTFLCNWFDTHYTIDVSAREYYSRFRLSNDKPLPPERQTEYLTNASVLKAVITLFESKTLMKRAMGGKVNWNELSRAINYYREKYNHTLPSNPLRFREKVTKFRHDGYESLISRKFLNQNTRKVSAKTEKLILSIAARPTNPYNNTIHEVFTQFMNGETDICNPLTGELFDRSDFFDKHGRPVEIGESTIWNYINNPKNQILLGKMRNTHWDFNNRYAPHHHRHSPDFSFSKISLDDRDLPRKTHAGLRPKAYYAYDVTSGCVVGYAYAQKKTADLFLDCMRNLFQTIEHNGWKIPAQAEVEHHLVRNFKDGLMQAGTIFPFIRWCNPGNSQEKRAEHNNRVKKYSVEKQNHVGIGRWYARLETNRTKVEKVYDENNDTYREPTYTYEELTADDIADIQAYNNQLHPNQTRYPGMSRWQVLCDNMNPELCDMDKAVLYKYIGEHTETTIRRTQYFTVRGIRYSLSSPRIVEKLQPNNHTVDVYYLPDAQGNINEVYVYQNDVLIDTCKPLATYNEAACEQTDTDKEIYTEQAKYTAKFRKMVKDEKIEQVIIIPKDEKEALADAAQTAKEVPKTAVSEIPPDDDFDNRAYSDPEYIKNLAHNSL